MASPARIGAHVGRAAEAGDAVGGDRRAVALEVDLQGRADEHVAGIEPGRLAEGAVRAQRAVRPGEEDVGAGRNVVLHADLGTEAMDLLDPAGLDRRDQRRMGIEREMAAHLALQAQLLAIGRQEQLDRGGVEADAVVEPPDAVGRVDALDRQHRRQDLGFGDGGGIAREQRLDVERLVRLDDEVHPVAGNVDARHLVDDLVHLGDDEAVLEGGRLDDGRRVLGVGAGIEIAVAVGADRGDQRDVAASGR